MIKKIGLWVFRVMCVFIGLYPVIYFLIDPHFGLLKTKTLEVLESQSWNIGFYGHIIFGGIALLIGWSQFVTKLRIRRMQLHRTIGMIYMLTVLISGICGLFIAQYATGGVSNQIGFTLSGVVWLSTTIYAFLSIRNGDVTSHENFMIYSYAVCFSAVTLRIWLPVLTISLGNFNTAYLLVGWLSWVPNLFVAHFIIMRKKRRAQMKMA